MTDALQSPAADDPARTLGALRLRPVQLAFAGVVALVLAVFTVVDQDVWQQRSPWLAAGGIAIATALAVAGDRLPGEGWLPIVVPTLNLLSLSALIVDPQAPRILAMLAVAPAFWLGLAGRRWGVALVVVAGAGAALTMALSIPGSVGVTLTANAVGAVLVPLALIAAGWFAHGYAGMIERQQRAILQREQEKLALAKLREADANLLDAIFETARVGLALLGPDGEVVRVNSTLATHPGLDDATVSEALADLQFLELDSRRPMPPAEAPFFRAARGEAFDNVICWIQRPGREPVAVTISSRPLLLDGEFRGSITSVDDVTTYMRMLEDRDDFVALVSHELRTPLTSITGFLELALDEDPHEPVRSWLSIVQRNADRLRALVEDLLIVGEMSRGDVQLETQRVDLRALAEEAVATLDHRARRRGIALRLAEGHAVETDADPRRVSQVIENLVSNGIKYTREQGSVEVRVEIDGADAVVRVVDDGPGVPQAEVLRVFERFYRSAEARASGVQGAGLGLWICRMIVHAHGGSMGFESEVGVGSTASFRLPWATRPATPIATGTIDP